MMDVGGLSLAGIERVEALPHLSGIIAFKDVNWYTQRFGIPYLLWLAAVDDFRGSGLSQHQTTALNHRSPN